MEAVAFDQLEPVAVARRGAGLTADDLAHAVAQARAEGVAEGRAAGMAEAQARVGAAEEALRAAASALTAERAAVADAVERAAVDLALRVAEHAVRAAIAAEPERVLDAIKGALRALVERQHVIVLVNPEDLEIVRTGLGAVVDELGGVGGYEVQAERRVTRGGAVVRTLDGEVDATLETKLAQAREAQIGRASCR